MSAQNSNQNPQRPQKETLKESLQPLVDAIREISSKKEEKSFWEKFYSFSLKFISFLMLVLLVCIIAKNTASRLAKGLVLIEPIGVTQDLDNLGYSQQAVANLLVDKCSIIIHNFPKGDRFRQFAINDDQPVPDVEILDTHLSINTIVSYTIDLLGQSPVIANGNIVGYNNNLTATIRVGPSPDGIFSIKGSTTNVDWLLSVIATNILAKTHPYILGGNYILNHDLTNAIAIAKICDKSKTPEENAEGNILWGMIYSELGNYSAAYARLLSATTNSLTACAGYGNIGLIELKQKEFKKALKYANDAVNANPNDTYGYLLRLMSRLVLNNTNGAYSDIIKAQKLTPNSGDVNIMLGQYARYANNDYAQAKKYFNYCVEIEPNNIRGYQLLADLELDYEHYSNTLDDCKAALSLDPLDGDSYLTLGEAFIKLNDYSNGLYNINKSISLNEFSGESYLARGLVEYKLHQNMKSIIDFSKTITLIPNYSFAYANRASSEIDINAAQALKDAQTATNLDDGLEMGHLELSNAQYMFNNYRSALAEANKSIAIYPSDPNAYFSRSRAEAAMTNYLDALNDANRGICFDTNNPIGYICRGDVYIILTNYSAGMADANTAILLDTNLIFGYLNRCVIRSEMADFDDAIKDANQAIELDTNCTKAYYLRGVAYQSAGKDQAAVNDFDFAEKDGFNGIDLYLHRSESQKKVGNYFEAIKDLDRAAILDSNNYAIYGERGLFKLECLDYIGCIKDENLSISLNSSDPATYVNRGCAELNLRRLVPAITDLSNCLSLLPKQSDASLAYMDLGLAFLLNGNTNKVEFCFSNSVINSTNIFKTHLDIATALYNCHQIALATEYLNKAIDINKNSAIAYNLRGLIELGYRNYKKVVDAENQATFLDTNLAVAYITRATADSNLGKFGEALKDANQAIKLNSENFDFYHKRASIKIQVNDYSGSLTDENNSIQLNTNYDLAYLNRGIAKMYLTNYNDAASDFSMAILINSNLATAFLNRGIALGMMGNYNASEEDFTIGLRLDPSSIGIYIKEAQLKTVRGDYIGAIQCCNKYIHLDPTLAVAYEIRALAEQAVGNFKPSLIDINKALLMNSESANAFAIRAEIEQKQDQFMDALTDISQAIKIDSNNTRYHQMLLDIKSAIKDNRPVDLFHLN